jgi:hypothetical protein
MEETAKRPISVKPYKKGKTTKYKATYEMNGSILSRIFNTQEEAMRFLYG